MFDCLLWWKRHISSSSEQRSSEQLQFKPPAGKVNSIEFSAGKPLIMVLEWMIHRQTWVTLVPHQDNIWCHNTKTVQEQPEEHDKELKVSTWPYNSTDPNHSEHELIHRHNHRVLLGLLWLKLEDFTGQRSSDEHRDPCFLLENYTVAIINVIHSICQRF